MTRMREGLNRSSGAYFVAGELNNAAGAARRMPPHVGTLKAVGPVRNS